MTFILRCLGKLIISEEVSGPAHILNFNKETNKWAGDDTKGSSNIRLQVQVVKVFVNGAQSIDILRPPDVEVTIYPHHRKPKYNEVVADKTWSQQIVTHELQHQVNSLLDMSYTNSNENPKFDYSKAGELMFDEVIRSLAIFSRARDEIIAFYRDGRNTSEIPKILINNRLYLPEYVSDENLQTTIHDLNQITISASDPKLKTYIEGKFERFVESCALAIEAFEQLGLSRDDIIAITVSLPALCWLATARRMRNYIDN